MNVQGDSVARVLVGLMVSSGALAGVILFMSLTSTPSAQPFVQAPKGNNLIWPSADFHGPNWGPLVGISLADNGTPAPDRQSRSTKIEEIEVDGIHRLEGRALVAPNLIYVFSIFVKAGKRSRLAVELFDFKGPGTHASARFDLNAAVAKTEDAYAAGVDKFGHGWLRIWLAKPLSTGMAAYRLSLRDSSATMKYAGTPGAALFIW